MRKIQIILLVLIVIGIGLIFTQKYWVENLVNFILQQNKENDSQNDRLNAITVLTEAEARDIAEKSCIKGGDALASGGTFNENSRTWWFDANLNAIQEGCNPACVVSEETKQAEINWRCTGAIPPVTEPEAIKCQPEQRNVDACIEIYQPVCATVEIQCIKAPCYPIEETFSNSCNACKNPLVKSYIAGECQKAGVGNQ